MKTIYYNVYGVGKCQAIDAGKCAIGAYDQEKLDSLLGLDGDEEFTIYLAPVGKK